MKGLIALILILTGGVVAADTTFEHGTVYSATSLQGNVWVQCAGQPSEYRSCAGYDLEPGMYTTLVSGADADKFQVEALHADGSTTKKKGKFDADSGKSSAINLWIRTLFQRPLLEMGANTVRYTLTKKGQVVEQGEFEVRVDRGARQVCPTGTIYSPGNDCGSTSYVCDMYFNRYCH
tara:strand:- start:185 stop:718 length:534 start_codon:yes stop_codon:yes gene_type:complete